MARTQITVGQLDPKAIAAAKRVLDIDPTQARTAIQNAATVNDFRSLMTNLIDVLVVSQYTIETFRNIIKQ